MSFPATMPRQLPFTLLDVFTDRAFGGNQLAVFTDAGGLTAAEMQQLAREMNLAESVFVLPAEAPTAARRLRIFTPGYEMPFAGHPIVGAVWTLASHGLVPLDGPPARLVLELNLGLMEVTVETAGGRPGFVWMDQRPARFGEPWTPGQRAAAAGALGLPPDDLDAAGPVQVVSTGVPYLVVPLVSLAALQRARPERAALQALLGPASLDEPVMVCAYLFTLQAEAAGHTAQARMFSPDPADLFEDAATGSAAGPLGAYLVRHGLTGPGRGIIEQGFVMGRPALIHVIAGGDGPVRVGGQAVIVGQGVISIP